MQGVLGVYQNCTKTLSSRNYFLDVPWQFKSIAASISRDLPKDSIKPNGFLADVGDERN